ncbi:MAG: hypothetical protein IJ568_07545 [Bacilli bacterium]|nr:hypothetical protein [Bacilli bacterium]
MINEMVFNIKQNRLLYNYLKYNSHWYKILNREPFRLKELEEEMKKEYKLRFEDRIINLGEKIELLSSFLEIMK